MSKKVLVVDDSNAIRSQVSAALGAAGFEVLEAKDGMDAMNKIMGAVELDLVVCDLNMPYIDGLKLVQFVKEHDRHAGLPFMMLTTEGHKDLIERARAAGAKAWMVKPVQSERLVAAALKLTA